MGADTKYYVTVEKIVTEVIELYAVTAEEAREDAKTCKDVHKVIEVKHWSEVEENQEC